MNILESERLPASHEFVDVRYDKVVLCILECLLVFWLFTQAFIQKFSKKSYYTVSVSLYISFCCVPSNAENS
jgi:hypothetical protein